MKKIVYIGNNIGEKNKYVPTLVTLSNLLKKEGYTIKIASNKKNKYLRILDMFFTVLLNYSKSDVVLIDTYGAFNYYYALLISQVCRFLRIRYIPILHGGNLPVRLKERPYFSKLIFSHAFKNIAPSNYLKSAFEAQGFPTELIPNIVEIADYQFKKRTKFKPKLLYVRAFHQIYNPTMAVRVLHLVQQKYPDATLCMIGPEKDVSFQETKDLAVKMGLENSIQYTGVLSKEAWHKMSEDYDIFINTTTIDNTPVSVMEAMAMGLPVVSTNVGGIPYLLEDGVDAYLVDSNDAEAMSAKIRALIEGSSNAEEVIVNARKKVEQFDWSQVGTKWNALFESVHAKPKQRWTEYLYDKSPVFIQNLMISIYGVYWKNRRFGGKFKEYLKQFKQHESFTPAQWHDYQTKSLRKLLVHAFTHVPFYNALYSKHGFTAADFENFTLEDLKSLPYLEKDDLRKFGSTTLLANNKEEGRFYSSSGSTGTPTNIYISSAFHQKWNALYELRVRNWAGVNHKMPRAMIGGRKVLPTANAKPPYYRYNRAESQIYFSAYHISEKTTADYVAGLHQYNIKYMVGYAKSIYLLAQNIKNKKIKAPKLKAVLTSSEKLTPILRQVIGEVFQCKVFDGYSGVEACGLISENKHGALFFSMDSGIMEVLDEERNDAALGTAGEVVATGLLNYDQPLIRYRIGDAVKLSANQQTKNGCQMLKIDEIEGRIEDVLIGTSGQKMVRFHGVFLGISSIVMAQVIQNTRQHILIKLVVDAYYNSESEQVITARIQSQLGEVQVDFLYVAEIERTKNGKFKAVISNLAHE